MCVCVSECGESLAGVNALVAVRRRGVASLARGVDVWHTHQSPPPPTHTALALALPCAAIPYPGNLAPVPHGGPALCNPLCVRYPIRAHLFTFASSWYPLSFSRALACALCASLAVTPPEPATPAAAASPPHRPLKLFMPSLAWQ